MNNQTADAVASLKANLVWWQAGHDDCASALQIMRHIRAYRLQTLASEIMPH